MIFTMHGEPVEIVDGPTLNLLDPTTVDSPLYQVRSLNDPTWNKLARVYELKADGGIHEIDAAIEAMKSKAKRQPTAAAGPDDPHRVGTVTGVRRGCGQA